jgi:hypothetical protein
MNYDKILEDEKHVLTKHVNMTYNDVENMSVYQRRMQIEILKEDVERQNKELEKQKSAGKNKFGR